MTSQDPDAAIRAALAAIATPSGGDLVGNGHLSGIAWRESAVQVSLEVDPAWGPAMEDIRQRAEAAIRALPGITSATVILTAERPAARPAPSPPPQRAAGRGSLVPEGVRHVLAVASGKGGVGKSTLAVNLACALKALGLRIGLLDADIYGPSVPRMTGLRGKPRATEDKKILPLEAFGMPVMSIGFLVEEDNPMIWRGPMVQSALTQMLGDCVWGELDCLVLDMPPGTGDAHLTIAQGAALSGAVIVSTPQDIALIDARKGLAMFRKVETPVLGIIENMSYFIAPDTGARYEIFGHGGAEMEARRLGVPFLGALPLLPAIRVGGDAGRPAPIEDPGGEAAQRLSAMARQIWDNLQGAAKPPPRIIVEE